MRAFFFLAFLLLIAVLIGCQSVPPEINSELVEKDQKKKNLEIVGDNLTKAQIDMIVKALAYLPKPFVESVTKIHLRDDIAHFQYDYNGKIRHAAAHHCSNEEQGKICVRPKYICFVLIWHEAAHVYTAAVEYSGSLAYEWVRIAGDVYTSFYEDYDGDPLSDGLLTNYSRRNYLEDIAEWVEECYNYLYTDPKSMAFQNKNFKTDQRYRKKLACLRKYGFISEKDYQKLKPLFE